jgi:osmotically-inducible protein OsmY
MRRDEQLIAEIKEELGTEPKVDGASVAVAASKGRVVLRGTVGSPREKIAAGRAAARVSGVLSVDNALRVRPLTGVLREDAELRADVLQALLLDADVPETVDVRVEDGVVTLTGTTEWQDQREEAQIVAGNIVGALDVVNEIELTAPARPDPGDVKGRIARSFRRNAALDAERLQVQMSNGEVTISGRVRSLAEHDDALAAAWATPGVKYVIDRITVDYVAH